MTDRYPYPEIRRNDTITDLAKLTEAEYARLEFQQTVFCAGEHVTTEPIKFGRAFEEPPFFTYSGVVRAGSGANAVGASPDNSFRFIEPGPITGLGLPTDVPSQFIGAMEAYWEVAPFGGFTGGFTWVDHVPFGPEVYAWTAVYNAGPGGFEIIDWTYEFNDPNLSGVDTIDKPSGGQDGDTLLIIIGRSNANEFTTSAWDGFTRDYVEAESAGDPRGIAGYSRQVTNWLSEPASYTWNQDGHEEPHHILMILVRGLTSFSGFGVITVSPNFVGELWDSPSIASDQGDFVYRSSYASEAAPVFGAFDLTQETVYFVGHLTVGVTEWIQDQQGMYIGANLWYKMTQEAVT